MTPDRSTGQSSPRIVPQPSTAPDQERAEAERGTSAVPYSGIQDGPLSHEQICALPPMERLVWVDQIRVIYPRWRIIHEEISRCHQMNTMAAEPQCLLITGPTGAGKTTLIESYAKQYPWQFTEWGVHRPVVMATIPSPATIGNLTTSLLYALGDPLAGRGTIGAQTLRIINYFRDCRVELIMLDELQHFVDRDSAKVLQNASNWLKTLIKETKVACVLVGLEGEAEQVVNINPQLARLFGDALVLAPFRWDEDDRRTIDEFRRLLVELERRLPLNEPSYLSSMDTAERCFRASDGTISYLMALLRRGTYLALQSGKERLDRFLLAQAFDQRLAGRRRVIQNPFVDIDDDNAAHFAIESAQADAGSPNQSQGLAGAVSSRSKRRKEPEARLSHLRER